MKVKHLLKKILKEQKIVIANESATIAFKMPVRVNIEYFKFNKKNHIKVSYYEEAIRKEVEYRIKLHITKNIPEARDFIKRAKIGGWLQVGFVNDFYEQ